MTWRARRRLRRWTSSVARGRTSWRVTRRRPVTPPFPCTCHTPLQARYYTDVSRCLTTLRLPQPVKAMLLMQPLTAPYSRAMTRRPHGWRRRVPTGLPTHYARTYLFTDYRPRGWRRRSTAAARGLWTTCAGTTPSESTRAGCSTRRSAPRGGPKSRSSTRSKCPRGSARARFLHLLRARLAARVGSRHLYMQSECVSLVFRVLGPAGVGPQVCWNPTHRMIIVTLVKYEVDPTVTRLTFGCTKSLEPAGT